MVDDMLMRPVGVVRSPVARATEMPRRGVPARVEVFSEFAAALLRIEANTHLVIVGWLHQANRQRLEVQRPWQGMDVGSRGVFACRSPDRPNPLGITAARLLRVEGATLYFDRLDLIDGTPVVDLKPHAHGLDSAFSARSARELSRLDHLSADQALDSMLHEAERFHGERCTGVVLGAKAMYHWMNRLDVAQKDPATVLWPGSNGCLADALQALTGATFGNGRLRVRPPMGDEFCLERDGHQMRFAPRPELAFASEEQIVAQGVEQLFTLQFVRGGKEQ